MLKWFYDTSTGAATGAACCGSFVVEGFDFLVASYGWTRWIRRFTWFGPSECNFLPESAYLSALTDLSVDPCEEASARAFYSSRSNSYIETRGPIGDPEMVETLYNI
jgi:hypothetical protein